MTTIIALPPTKHALLELLVLSVSCGPLGVWIALARQQYAAESLSHGLFPGVIIGTIVGLSELIGGIAGVLGTVALIALGLQVARLRIDVAIGSALAATLAIGSIAAVLWPGSTQIASLLFGDLLAVEWADVRIAAALSCLVLTVLVVIHRPLFAACFGGERKSPRFTKGASPDLLLLLLIGGVVVVLVPALGVLLAVGWLLAPGATALNLTSKVHHALLAAPIVAMVAGVLGIVLSSLVSTAAGASVAVCSIALWALSSFKLVISPSAR